MPITKLLRKISLIGAALLAPCFLYAQTNLAGSIPKLIKTGKSFQLIVDNKPFIILGGELGNSSASNTRYMKPIWPKLKTMHLNTVIAPVYWELMEPVEGKFDFKLVDDLLEDARKYEMKIVLLWFGSWKNSMSCYAPEWVKRNTARFPRINDQNGVAHEILTPFSKNNLEADKRAFAALMAHVKETDSRSNTVVAIQVENEIGMLPDARNYDVEAEKAFNSAVPAQLITYLKAHQNTLLPELKAIWQKNGYKTTGNWENIFGKSLATDELFMAWYFAKFTNEVTLAGKKEYPLPMYLNAALNRPDVKPGKYPSAGPLPHVMDLWLAGATDVDILAPDFYNPDFKHWCDLYTRLPNPLFIPEIKFEEGVDAKAFFAFGNYNCLSFSPFSIESTDAPEKEPIGKAYAILEQLSPLITRYQTLGTVKGVLFDNSDTTVQKLTLGNYNINLTHDYKLGWSPEAKKMPWPTTGAIIISISPDEFYIAGTGVVATFEPIEKGKKAGFISIDEGYFENEKWIAGRRMNGDQDHQGRHVRVPAHEYSIQHVKMYTY